MTIAPRAADLLRLLADPTRLRVLHLLGAEPLTVAELQDLLALGQSSVSSHLARLKRAGFIHDLPEGSARRYRLRADLPSAAAAAWAAAADLSRHEPEVASDADRLDRLRRERCTSWVERVAGSLHREYAPGRTWEAIGHGLLHFARFGRCCDVGAGDGALIEVLAPRCDDLVCVDPSPAMVQAGAARIRDLGLANVRYVQAAAEDLDLPAASRDSVLLLQSLRYVVDPAAVLARARRLLAPGGRLLVLTLLAHPWEEARRYGHRHLGFAEADLAAWLAGLHDLRLEHLEPEANAPRFQTVVATGIA